MTTLFQALMLILDVVWFIMIAHIIMSWLINFDVLNLRQPLVAQVWDGLSRLLEPIYRPIRNVLPNMGGLDLAPLVVFIGIIILQRALVNNAGFFLGYCCPPTCCARSGASTDSAPASRRSSRRWPRAATCWRSCPRAAASRSATSCRR